MKDTIISQLKALSGFARWLGFTAIADFADMVVTNPGILDFVADLIEKTMAQQSLSTAEVKEFSVSSLSEADKEFLTAQSIDIGKIIQLIQLFMEIFNSLRPKLQAMTSESC